MHNSVIRVAGKHLENFFCLFQEAGAEVAQLFSHARKAIFAAASRRDGAVASLIPFGGLPKGDIMNCCDPAQKENTGWMR